MPLPKGTMTVQILPDGRVKIETGDMGGVAHKSADEFMEDFTRLLGGPVEETKLPHAHVHTHQHDHTDHHHHQ